MTANPEISREPLPEWEANFPERKRRALAAAHRLSDDDLADHDAPILVRAILDEHAATRMVGRFDLKWNQPRESMESSLESLSPAQMNISFNVPVEGAGLVLFNVPNRSIHSGGTAHSANLESQIPRWTATVRIALNAESDEGWQRFEQHLSLFWTEWEKALIGDIKVGNELIDEHRADVETTISSIVEARRDRVVALRSASANLSIPLGPVTAPSVEIPVTARLLTLSQVEIARSSGVPELALSDEIADGIMEIIASFGRALERLPKTASRIIGENEEGIRDLLLFILNANYGGLATGETFVGSGKTDILLRWRDKDAFIAECKFWDGESKFKDAVDQVLGYTVWRDTRVAVILFIRDRVDISATIEKAITCISRHERCLSSTSDADSGGSPEFMLASTADDKRAIRLTLLTVVIPRSG